MPVLPPPALDLSELTERLHAILVAIQALTMPAPLPPPAPLDLSELVEALGRGSSLNVGELAEAVAQAMPMPPAPPDARKIFALFD